jgi:hypothetical protein
MSKNQVSDPITDQEIAFAHLVLSGTMTDRRAAEAVGLNPETAAYTKAKPRVREYMNEHRAAMHEQSVQQETEELRRRNQSRERVLTRLWEIANMDPERTRNSMSAQIKAMSTIVAIEDLIPARHSTRRAVSAQNAPAPPPVQPQVQPSPDLDEDGPGAVAAAPSDLGPAPDPTLVNSSKTTPSAPHAPVSASAPDNRNHSSAAKKPDTWRLRL